MLNVKILKRISFVKYFRLLDVTLHFKFAVTYKALLLTISFCMNSSFNILRLVVDFKFAAFSTSGQANVH